MSGSKGTVLVAGGSGYIGSHTVIELYAAGFDVVVLDNLVNSSKESTRRVAKIVGKEIPFEEVDLLDHAATDAVFAKYKFAFVIHFAGLKAVGESVAKPLLYYNNNLTGTLNLLDIMGKHGVKKLVFSSSATVYGDPQRNPIDEAHPVGGCTNPYGQTKFFIEEMCRDLCKSDETWSIVLLRYFNPVGAHKSGTIGEDPNGIPNNLLPYIAQVAIGRRAELSVFGNDYDTPDGTGVRDYIHVVDLAKGHVAALNKISSTPGLGCEVYNLGSGKGSSVLDMVAAFAKASGKEIKYKMCPRRAGDVASCYAEPAKALKELGWKTERTVEEACEDSWRWQSSNPNGFATA